MKLRALAATGRIANLPSIVCNVWLGIALATAPLGGARLFWLAALPLVLVGSALYLAGNFLNDWADRRWDASHRPERALPRGLFHPRSYLAIAIGCAAAGLGMAWITSPASTAVAGGILTAVILYTIWHKRSPWAVIAMGLCRALLPLMGALGCPNNREILWIAAVCGCGQWTYIAGLSLSARYESLAAPPPWIAPASRLLLLLAPAIVFISAYPYSSSPSHRLLAVLPYGIWLALCLSRWRKPLPQHISRLLAGIPLLDAIALIPLGLAHPPCLFTTICLWLPATAFLAALALQRLALAS
jgi:UbiA prenyltransferase family